jgi:peptidoglycan/LPS O-acetylase OafA/YrhL
MWPPSPAAGLALLAIVAPLSYRYVEQPFLDWKKRYTRAANRHGTQVAQEELVPARAEDGRA